MQDRAVQAGFMWVRVRWWAGHTLAACPPSVCLLPGAAMPQVMRRLKVLGCLCSFFCELSGPDSPLTPILVHTLPQCLKESLKLSCRRRRRSLPGLTGEAATSPLGAACTFASAVASSLAASAPAAKCWPYMAASASNGSGSSAAASSAELARSGWVKEPGSESVLRLLAPRLPARSACAGEAGIVAGDWFWAWVVVVESAKPSAGSNVV